MFYTNTRVGLVPRSILAAWMLVEICTAFCSFSAAASPAKPILAHYMPWYVAKPYSTKWGWHWTMNHFNPDQVDASGQRQIASHFYPLIGPYDSADPAVLEYHVLLMKLAGIDGVIVDWYGKDNYADYGMIQFRTSELLKWVERAGLSFALCYEDKTIQEEINDGLITTSNALQRAQETMLFADTNFFRSSTYFRIYSRPVLLDFGPQFFKGSQWPSIFSVLPATNRPVFFTLDNRIQGAAGAFNWPPMWLSQSGVLSPSALEGYLARFDQTASSWQVFASSAFPRFEDIYAQAGVSASYGSLADRGGETLRSTLTRAVTNGSAFVQLVTWNDFGEGTVIEPTREYGFRDLAIVQEFQRKYANLQYASNDLAVAASFYALRRASSTDAVVTAELDRTFTNLVSGKLSWGQLQVRGLEQRRPAIYGESLSERNLTFAIGGYVPAEGVAVETTTNLSDGNWTIVASFPATTNLVQFSTDAADTTPRFFRVRVAGP